MDITVMILQPYQLQSVVDLFQRAGVETLRTYEPQMITASALDQVISSKTKWQCPAVIPMDGKIVGFILFSPESSPLVGGRPFQKDQIVVDTDLEPEAAALIEKYLEEFAVNLVRT